MSSRRKQYKPKAAFGLTEQEQIELEKLNASSTTPTPQLLTHNPIVQQSDEVENTDETSSHTDRKRKRDSADLDASETSLKQNRNDDFAEPFTTALNNTQNDAAEDAFDCDNTHLNDEEDDIGDELSDEEDGLDDTHSASMNMTSQFNGSQLNTTDVSFMYTNDPNSSQMLLMFKCKVCGKAFKHRRSLNRHVKLHSGEKNFKCPYCTTAFARSDHLKAHIRTHNNSKPYRCSICQCGYSTQAALKVHIAHHHSKSKFKCAICNDLEFHSQLALEGHIYTKHSKENADLNDLINETATMNPTLVPMDETATYNLINQRTRLIDINNYSNLNGNGKQQMGNVKSEFCGSNADLDMKQPDYYDLETKYECEQEQDETREMTNEDSKHHLVKIAPKPIASRNTYCELCNARFSNIESYSAHMRNCHPSIPVQQQQSSKMPFLTSILSTPTQTQTHAQTKTVKHSTPATVTPIAKPCCTVANCNCSRGYSARVEHFEDYKPSSDSIELQNEDYFVCKETRFTCVQCNLSMLKNSEYMLHIRKEHCVEVYRCVLCKQMQLFDNLNLLKDHFFQVHQSHKYDLYKCKLCVNSNSSTINYNNLDDLALHLKQSHNQILDINRFNHSRVQAAQTHQYGYPPPPPPPPPQPQPPVHLDRYKLFKCSFCDSDFAQQNSLNQHIQMCHPTSNPTSQQQQQFSCQYCRNTFSNKAQLERHIRIHLSSIDLKCNICDRVFDTEPQLAEHKQTHSKTFDSLSTASSSNLSTLSSTTTLSSSSVGSAATATATAMCAYCKQSIENEQQFKEHFKRHNNIGVANQSQQQTNRANSYMCIVCRQSLTSNYEYSLHSKHHLRGKQNVNGKTMIKCAKCPVKFEDGQDYVGHMKKMHPNETNELNCPPSPSSSTNSHLAFVKDERKSPVDTSSSSQSSQVKHDFLCEICSSKFDSQFKLQTHLIVKHEFQSSANNSNNGIQNPQIQTFMCPVCDEAYNRPDQLLQHTQVHGQAAKIYKCTKCPLAFVFKSQLINHSFSHQSNNNHRQLESTPNNQSHRAAINRAQSNQTLKTLNTQNNQITSVVPRQLQQHQAQSQAQSQARVSPVQLKTESASQQQQQQQEAQYIVHTNSSGVKTYTCLACSKTFANQRNLNVHIRIHTGFRPFECDVCKRKFTRRENLRSHMKCHLNLRPFTCSICSRSFRRKSHVVSHIEVHFKSKLHNCVECGRQFEDLDVFLAHLIRDHSTYDKELIALIKQRNLLDLDQFNINYESAQAKAAPGTEDSMTIQSMIDQTSKSINDLDYNYDNDESPIENGFYNDEEVEEVEEIVQEENRDFEDDVMLDEEQEEEEGEGEYEDEYETVETTSGNVNVNEMNAADVDNYLNAIDENGLVDDDDNDDEIDYTD